MPTINLFVQWQLVTNFRAKLFMRYVLLWLLCAFSYRVYGVSVQNLIMRKDFGISFYRILPVLLLFFSLDNLIDKVK